MRVAGVHFPPFSFPVDEGAVTGHRVRAVPGVTHAVVDEPEALARLDAEGFGIVSHRPTLPVAKFCEPSVVLGTLSGVPHDIEAPQIRRPGTGEDTFRTEYGAPLLVLCFSVHH
jgi:hypothetical protein